MLGDFIRLKSGCSKVVFVFMVQIIHFYSGMQSLLLRGARCWHHCDNSGVLLPNHIYIQYQYVEASWPLWHSHTFLNQCWVHLLTPLRLSDLDEVQNVLALHLPEWSGIVESRPPRTIDGEGVKARIEALCDHI